MNEPFADAVERIGALAALIRRERERTESLPERMRGLRSEPLLEWLSERDAFQDRSRSLQEAIAAALVQACVPDGDPALEAPLAALRAEAEALRACDARNAELTGRSLACVRGYARALRPPTEAYDRRGRATGAP